MLRPLIIDAEVKARIREVVEFAALNHYHPGKSETVPGDDPRYTVDLLTYRAVFTFTVDPVEEKLFRHLSISVPGDRYPNPFAFCTIADLFGFTGWDGKSLTPPGEWHTFLQEDEHCIVAVQPI